MTNLPVAYEGKEPYIFISYAHKNADRVMPIISELQNRGFRVWYDDGIEAGTEWPEFIAQHLLGSGCVLAMLTKEALESHNCRREIHFAISRRIPMLAVYLDEMELSAGMDMQLGVLQAIYYTRQSSPESFMDKLCAASVLLSCKENGAEVVSPESSAPEEEEKICLSDLGAECFYDLAVQGDAGALYELGNCYSEGRGVEQSDEEAAVCYGAAAGQGHPEAQYKLGLCFKEGKGVRRSRRKARHWMQQAVWNGCEQAFPEFEELNKWWYRFFD